MSTASTTWLKRIDIVLSFTLTSTRTLRSTHRMNHGLLFKVLSKACSRCYADTAHIHNIKALNS